MLKITNTQPEYSVVDASELEMGQPFVYAGDLCIRVDPKTYPNISDSPYYPVKFVHLRNGVLNGIDNSAQVKLVEAEVKWHLR